MDEPTPSSPHKVLLLFLRLSATLASDTWLCSFWIRLSVPCMRDRRRSLQYCSVFGTLDCAQLPTARGWSLFLPLLLLALGDSSMLCPSDRKPGELDWVYRSLKFYARHWEDYLLRPFPLRWAECPESKALGPALCDSYN